MIHTTIDPTRNGQDFADHIEQTIQTAPHATWIFVMDNLNTHHGEEVVRRIAQLHGIPEDTLRSLPGSAWKRSKTNRYEPHRNATEAILFGTMIVVVEPGMFVAGTEREARSGEGFARWDWIEHRENARSVKRHELRPREGPAC